jgi:site-specific DNA-cytosine methylase
MVKHFRLDEDKFADILFSQGFSRLNRFPKTNDSRNYLMLSFLSAVDMLRPRYIVIENRLDNLERNRTSAPGGIAQGMMKVIKRVLTAMKSVER